MIDSPRGLRVLSRSAARSRTTARPSHRGALAALGRAASASILLGFVLSPAALAIPSPDVVISLFASAAQVLGVATVVLGRWFFVRRGQVAGATAGKSISRIPFLAASGLFVATLLGWGFFYLHVEDQRMARLQVNLLRTSVENGKLVGDVNLKTLSFSEQKQRPDGMTTEELQAVIDQGSLADPIFDIRETEEVEMGAIANTRHMRYPDLLGDPAKYLEPGSPVVLLCFNGNRSSETADALREAGYRPRFLIGGYEKWCAEERPLVMQEGYERKDLREIPDYANKETLLETEEVTRLVQEEDALFLDVRYPGEYETLGHLPGAWNLTMRSMTTPELELALAAIPKRPLIGVCYDKRSSFYCLIVGLRMSRLGYDWRGRYTVPEEYFVPSKDKAHVLAWQEAHQGKSVLAAIATPMAGTLESFEQRSGSLAWAILALVLVLRLALLPFTWKAERDRWKQRSLEAELAQLAKAYGDDRSGAARARMQRLKAARVRPLVNLLGSSLQLVLFLVFFTVVSDASAASQGEGFLWIPELSGSDPSRILPIVIGLLAVATIACGAVKFSWARTSLWVALGCGLFFLVVGLSGGVLLYLTASLGLMLVHTVAARKWCLRDPERSARRRAQRFAASAVVPLADAHRVEGAGRKAARLGELIAAGLPVPAGFAVRAPSVQRFLESGTWSREDLAEIRAAHARLGTQRVAVRSSGANEDGAAASYAGIYDSILDVPADGLVEALSQVARSLGGERARAYANATASPERLGIVVQAMVPAEYAGVLFTEHPGESGAMLIELVAGLGEDLVSGRVQPKSHRYGRVSARSLDPKAAPIELRGLVELGQQVERLFGRPQDVEWAYAAGRFHLLQARDITRSSRSGFDERALREEERARLLELARGAGAEEVVFAQNELSELLPEPSPYSLALMEELWAHGGSTDLACRELSVPYDVHPDSPPFVISAFGRLYIHRREETRRLAKGSGVLASFRLSRGAEAMERRFREEFLPGFLDRSRLDLAVDMGRLTQAELSQIHRQRRVRFVREVYVQAEMVNVAADILFKNARRALEKHGLDPAEHLAHGPRTVVEEAFELLGEVGRGTRPSSEFVAVHGHRSPLDYELAEPRYGDDPALVERMAARSAPSLPHAARSAPELPRSAVLALSVGRARRFAALKEEAKHHALRELAFLRRVLVALGSRTGIGSGIFLLTPAEVDALDTPALPLGAARALIEQRAERADALRDVRIDSQLTPLSLETLDVERGQHTLVRPGRARLHGTRVSGRGGLCGRVRVLRAADEIGSLRPGEILVARFTDPAWTPVFPRCGGIVTEVGGWLSHAAILAREHGITAIVGTEGALESLVTGNLVRLGEDGSVEIFTERRIDARRELQRTVLLQRTDGECAAELRDVSRFGARLSLVQGALTIGERLGVSCPRGVFQREAVVVRNGTPGLYGVSFEEALEEHHL